MWDRVGGRELVAGDLYVYGRSEGKSFSWPTPIEILLLTLKILIAGYCLRNWRLTHRPLLGLARYKFYFQSIKMSYKVSHRTFTEYLYIKTAVKRPLRRALIREEKKQQNILLYKTRNCKVVHKRLRNEFCLGYWYLYRIRGKTK